MRRLPLLVLAFAALIGCNNSAADTEAVKPPAAPMNPSGKPRDAREEAMAEGYAKAGPKINEAAAAAAKARAEAMRNAGVH